MCRGVKPGEEIHEIVVRLGTDETDVKVTCGRQLERVDRILLTEYHLNTPNGGAAVVAGTDHLTVQFQGRLHAAPTGNLPGGNNLLALGVDNAAITHRIYDDARIWTRDVDMGFNSFEIRVRNINETVPTYLSLTLYINVICKIPGWIPKAQMLGSYLTTDASFADGRRGRVQAAHDGTGLAGMTGQLNVMRGQPANPLMNNRRNF